MAPGLVPHLDGNGGAVVLDHLVADNVGQDAYRLSPQAFACFENLAVIVDRETVAIVQVEIISRRDGLNLKTVVVGERDSTDNSRTELLFHQRRHLAGTTRSNKC